MRGLKCYQRRQSGHKAYVAPYTGAWIEIDGTIWTCHEKTVAPYTGAWIEISVFDTISFAPIVAPYTGAWIEMFMYSSRYSCNPGRTLHGCVD